MKNYKIFSKIALIIVYIFIFALLFFTVALPFGARWYVEVKDRSSELAAVLMLTCYPCVPFAFYALFSLRRLMSNFIRGDFFNESNFKSMKVVGICCAVSGMVMLIAGFFYMPFFISGAAAQFCALVSLTFYGILLAVCPKCEETENLQVEE